jgi:hypothetical protein
MPRAQRTKSAVHEALQRRAGQRPGASFSVKLDAPPHLWLRPYRFHTVVFRSRHVIKHTQASHHTIRPPRTAQISHALSAMHSAVRGVLLTTKSPAALRWGCLWRPT